MSLDTNNDTKRSLQGDAKLKGIASMKFTDPHPRKKGNAASGDIQNFKRFVEDMFKS